MQLEILRRIGGAYLVRQDEAYHMAYPEAGYYTAMDAAEAFLGEKAEDFQEESPTLERIAALLADPEARRERPEWAKADFSADCYLLDEAHVTPFLPFLYPSGREDAQRGRIRVIGAAKNDAAIGALAFSTAAETAVPWTCCNTCGTYCRCWTAGKSPPPWPRTCRARRPWKPF